MCGTVHGEGLLRVRCWQSWSCPVFLWVPFFFPVPRPGCCCLFFSLVRKPGPTHLPSLFPIHLPGTSFDASKPGKKALPACAHTQRAPGAAGQWFARRLHAPLAGEKPLAVRAACLRCGLSQRPAGPMPWEVTKQPPRPQMSMCVF